MLLDRHEQPLNVCADPECPYWRLADARHWDVHNPPCARRFLSGGRELLCALLRGHRPPCRALSGERDG